MRQLIIIDDASSHLSKPLSHFTHSGGDSADQADDVRAHWKIWPRERLLELAPENVHAFIFRAGLFHLPVGAFFISAKGML